MTIQQNYPAIKPTLNLDFANTKQLDPRITYSRTSTGTYYDGKTVAKAEENLLTQSGNVAVWTQLLGASRTANATVAPDGTTTAGSLTVDSSTGRHFVSSTRGGIAPIGSTITGSVFLKASTYGFASVQLSNDTVSAGTPRYTISVDLSNGTIGGFAANSGVSGQTASVVSAGNGWYRVILTMTTVGAGGGDGLNIIVTPMPTNGSTYTDGGAALPSFTGDGTSGIFIWGAQVELRSTATAYTPTTTAPITNYIPVLQTASAGTPRFDHNPITGESLGLLVEEQRTNLITYSEDFDNPFWPKTAATLFANAGISPDGTKDADLFVPSATAPANFYRGISLSNGTYTYSIYLKQFGANGSYRLYLNDASSSQSSVEIALTGGVITTSSVAATGVYSNASSSLTSVGNGWYRVSLTATLTNGAGPAVALISTGPRDGFSGVYLWGAQLEAGAFATSYIPTVASQVTRAADSASMTGTNFSSWYNQSEGSIYVDIAKVGSNTFAFDFSDNTTNNRTYHRLLAQQQTIVAISNGANQCQIYDGTAFNTFAAKVTFGYKLNDFVTRANGGASATTEAVDAFGVIPVVDRVHIGCTFAATGQINGTIKKLAYYPRRLTNTQLQALTT